MAGGDKFSPSDYGRYLRLTGVALAIPAILAASPLVGYFLGHWVGGMFGGPTVGGLIGLVVGFIAGIRETIRLVRRLQSSLK